MNEKISNEKNNTQYLKINSSSYFEFLSDKEYSKEINQLPKMFNTNNIPNEDKIVQFLNIILPENKEGDILKINFALSSGCKKNKENSHKCLNEIMNMKETSDITLTKDFASNLSQIIKEIFRRIKKYSSIKTYEELINQSKNFLYKGGNIINKFMVEKKSDQSEEKLNNNLFYKRNESISGFQEICVSKTNINLKAKMTNTIVERNKTIQFEFKDIGREKKKNLPAEMRCLIKKFTTVKNLKLSINNNMSNNQFQGFHPDITDIQNIIIVLYNSEWLFQNLLEIEIDLSNDSLLRNQFAVQIENFKTLSEKLKKDLKISVYHFGLSKNIIFNPYQLSNFYPSGPKYIKDNFLYIYRNINEESILTYELDNEEDLQSKEDLEDDFINKKKYLLELIVVYAYFLLKIKNIRICYLKSPINYQNEIIKILNAYNIFLDEFNFFGFFKENSIHHFTIDFNSLDNLSFQKILNFIGHNGLLKIFRINFFESEEYFKGEMLYKILQNNETNYQNLVRDFFNYDDNNSFIYDLKINENIEEYILRKLFDKFKENICCFFYLITMRTNINELSLIFDIPNILVNKNNYMTLILKFILNLIIFIDSPMSNLAILSIQAESIILNTKQNIFLQKFFDKLSLYKNKNNNIKSLTLHFKLYHIIDIYKLIPYGIEYLSLGTLDLETLMRFTDYITSIDFSENSKLKKLTIFLNRSIFKYEQCKEYLEQLLIEHPRNLSQISIYTYISIKYKELKELLLKSNYNIIENIFFSFSKASLKDEGYKEKLKMQEYKKITIIDRNFLNLFCVQRKKKNTRMIIELIYKLSRKINKSFSNYNIFLNIDKFIESMDKKINIVEFK